jgi:peroxin-14
MIDKNKESQNQSLAELQQELKSLKALLLSRGPSLSSAPASPLPSLAARPSIPSWQLAGMNPPSKSSTPPAAPVTSSPTTAPSVEDKGKAPSVEETA